jgi:hypothetical protein
MALSEFIQLQHDELLNTIEDAVAAPNYWLLCVWLNSVTVERLNSNALI